MVNKAILIGNVGNDPELRNTQTSTSVTNLRLATHDTRKKGDQRVEFTEWHRLVFFGGLSEIVAKYVKKGDPLYVEGRIQTRKITDTDGKDRYTTEIVVREMKMLKPRKDGPSIPLKSV